MATAAQEGTSPAPPANLEKNAVLRQLKKKKIDALTEGGDVFGPEVSGKYVIFFIARDQRSYVFFFFFLHLHLPFNYLQETGGLEYHSGFSS